MVQNIYRPFPVHSFPEPLRNVLFEVQLALQCPIELVASSVLAALSHASQHAISVKRGGIVSPVSLFVAVIADSGERKSTVDRLVMRANRLHQGRLEDSPAHNAKNYEAFLAIWEVQRKGILARIKQAVRKGEDTECYQEELVEHLGGKPAPSNPPHVIYTDTNIEALLEGLHQSWPSALLISAEGAAVFAGHAIRGMDKLNVLWDGGDLPKDRMGVSFTIQGARLTSAIMIQLKPFLAFMERRGEIARGIGFLARNLIAYPRSTQGTRFINGIPNTNLTHLAVFHARIAEMLSTDEGKKQFQELEMSPEAYASWLNFYNLIEADLADGRYLSDIRDFGSKIADNAARIAALFHHYLGRDQLIQLDCVNYACAIAGWYALGFKELFGQSQIPQEQIDAQILEEWLWNLFRQYNNIHPIRKQRIRTYGPNQLRNAGRLNGALWILSSAQKISIEKQGKTEVIFPSLQYFGGQHPPQQPIHQLPYP